MNLNRRTENIPQYIRELFAATKDGKIKITCYTEIEGPYDRTYEVDWTVADAEKVVERYEALKNMFREIEIEEGRIALGQ